MAKLEELSPAHFAEDWDNVGLLVGRPEKEVKSVYITLDATDEAIEEAVKLGADMVISHHPMIFKGIKQVRGDNFIGRRIIRLAQNDMCYFAMHTNFDIMGMADAAADELKLRNREVLETTYEDEISTEGFGRFGKLPRIMTLRECAAFVKVWNFQGQGLWKRGWGSGNGGSLSRFGGQHDRCGGFPECGCIHYRGY